MQSSTERLLRYRLGLDLVIPGFIGFGMSVMAIICVLALFTAFVVQPIENRLFHRQPVAVRQQRSAR